MPVKYECPKCEKRFVDWGAEKLKFQCPSCEGEQLVKVGASDDRPAKKPTLRRKAKAVKVPVVPELIEEDDEVVVTDDDVVVDDDDAVDDDAVVDDDDETLDDDDDAEVDGEVEITDDSAAELDEKL